MADRDISLFHTLSRVKSSAPNERAKALTDIKHIFRSNEYSLRIENLSDKTWHSLFEALFECAHTERTSYLRHVKGSQRSVETRLESCASTLRAVVEVGVTKLRNKTVRALIDHILQTLPISDGYCGPLSVDYLKVLRIVFQYQPHVEHLREYKKNADSEYQEWSEIVEFCVDAINYYAGHTDSGNSDTPLSTGRSLLQIPTTSADFSTKSVVVDSMPKSPRLGRSLVQLEELVSCIRYLTNVTNAPVPKKATVVLNALVKFLQTTRSVGRAHHHAISAINSVLTRIIPHSIEAAQQAVLQILPLIKDLWLSKSATFRDEMLASLVLARSHVMNVLGMSDVGMSDHLENVDGLLDVLVLDYARRSEREQLALDDLSLKAQTTHQAKSIPLQNIGFRLRSGNLKGEASWTLVELISFYASALDGLKKHQSNAMDPDVDLEATSVKRMRLSSRFEDFLQQTIYSSGSSKLSSLQILTFMVRFTKLDVTQIENILDRLMPLLTSERGSVSSWALLFITNCAFQDSAADESLHLAWEKVTQLSTKLISSISCCRAACHLLDVIVRFRLVSSAVLSVAVDNILSSTDLVGPVVLADSSLSFWSTLLDFKTTENPSSAPMVCERALSWLFSRFTPSKMDEKSYTSHSGTNFDTSDLLRLLSRCVNQNLCPNPTSNLQHFGVIGQAWQRASSFESLTNYLLLLDSPVISFRTLPDQTAFSSFTGAQARPSAVASRFTTDFCIREVNNSTEKWQQLAAERTNAITPSGIRLVACLCLVSDAVAAGFNSRVTNETERLVTSNSVLAKEVAAFVALKECDQVKVDALFDLMASSMPDVAHLGASSDSTKLNPQCLNFLLHLSKSVEERSKSSGKFNAHGVDLMDLDTGFESQASNGHHNSEADLEPRDLSSFGDNSFRTCISQYMALLSSYVEALVANEPPNYFPSSFAERLINIPPEALCASQPLLQLIFSSSLLLQSSSMEELIDYVGGNFLENYDFNRNEIALSICVDMLSHFADQWTDSQMKSLHEAAGQIYHWFVSVALPNNLCSVDIKCRLITLFFRLLEAKGPEFRGPENDQSVRTYVFTLLKSTEPLVIDRVCHDISNFFNYFVLGEHETVFSDLYKNIPQRSDWAEGLALRLMALTNLGSRWPTLLRRCLYHVFETAGMVQRTLGHAKLCVSKIATAVGLEESKALFQLFSPQLIYTWLSVQPLATIPFGIFDYESLDDLLRDSQDEAFPQAMMRGKDAEVSFLTETLGCSAEDILKSTFAKSAAYCISWDIDKDLSGGKTGASEGRLTALLTKKKSGYTESLSAHMPFILGTFISTMEHDHHIAKTLAKRSSTQACAVILNEMMKTNSSTYVLPADQQPSFPAKTLPDRITRLCQRLGVKDTKLWDTPVYVFVLRMLFGKIHPALGPLHACSIIRKVRVLIALAGPTALSGYAIEMALWNLLPFTTDKQCAEDALGMVQYLLHRGMHYLGGEVSTVTGLAVSALVSLRKFVGSSQDSTTQESQHLATMEKAKAFHVWLSRDWYAAYSSELKKLDTNEKILASFANLINSAADANAEANAIEGTIESRLLTQLLDEVQSEKPLLRLSTINGIIRSLCSQFRPPPSYHRDVLGRDENAEAYAASIWHSSRVIGVNDQFRLWSARALGRAYNSSGASNFLLDSKLKRESTKSSSHDPNELDLSSKHMIFECLKDLLTSSNTREAGLTEDTIRLIISRSQSVKGHIQTLLPSNTIYAFSLNPADSVEPIASFQPLSLDDALHSYNQRSLENWLQVVCISLANKAFTDPILSSLVRLLRAVPRHAELLFSPILHLVLLYEYQNRRDVYKSTSTALKSLFRNINQATISHAKAALNAITYLRKQPVPKETNFADREQWLDVDYASAARAAEYSHLHTIALLLAETGTSRASPQRSSKRSSGPVQSVFTDNDVLLAIYKNIDEPDSFYGVRQDSNLGSVLNRLHYEGEGFKSLLFHGAQADSDMRRLHSISTNSASGLTSALNSLNLNTLTYALLSNELFKSAGSDTAERALDTGRKLNQWDIRTPERTSSEPSIIYAVLQGISNATTAGEVRRRIDQGFSSALETMTAMDTSPEMMRAGLRTLGILTEIDDVMGSLSLEDLKDVLVNMTRREDWMQSAQAKDVRPVISTRQTVFGLLSAYETLQSMVHLNARDARKLEVENISISCRVSKQLEASQELLASATYLSDIVSVCDTVGLNITADAERTMAEVLWDQGEKSASIHTLQKLMNAPRRNGDIDPSRAMLLAQLGHNIAEARLEHPEDIMNTYLRPAVEEFREDFSAPNAGKVLHEFATFCDRQLSNREESQEVTRLRKARDQREKEVRGLMELLAASKSKSKREQDRIKSDWRKANKWLMIENNEYEKLKNARESYLSQSLKNYLLSLSCSDDHDNDVLRFISIWLEFADDNLANGSVMEVIDKVPTAKFVVLMSQLTSRLQTEKTDFQTILTKLIVRICSDHPYHAMHNVFAAIQSSGGSIDQAAKSRISASNTVAKSLQQNKKSSRVWSAIHHSDTLYNQLALLRDDTNIEASKEVDLDKYAVSKAIFRVKEYHVPPPTLAIPLRADLDYSKVPVVTGFVRYMRIANGLSTPKIVTALCSDGTRFKQLFKGGSDDLRQDMIMEQVFEQASKLLKNHTATRQRNLRIRTYKVLPLSSRSGTMEFVQNTVALYDAIMPAHESYYPKDIKHRTARTRIHDCAGNSTEMRVKEFRKVCDQFHPVLRYFFLERFLDPDEWFARRLAYTRTTAAISILGHVLGLGDRHCHNILLDEQTGEVVHIDLGVAFEAGRALPIPEVVPFRLTRDLVDGMGINKTEGVFRRCCEFTLEALRDERESIITLLNVLRYDPLYSWTVSPLRAKRMQESDFAGARDQSRAPSGIPEDGVDVREMDAKKDENELGEAERALAVVEKKLSKSLSTTATVSELIQQATDERNLAVLFAGWAAYA